MITIEYTESGESVSDFNYGDVVKKVKGLLALNIETTLWYSSSIAFTAIRLAIVKGEIPHDQIQFKFKDQILLINKIANLESWPIGFCDAETDMTAEIIGWRTKI